MKRAERLLEQVADPDNLRLAAWKAAKGKRYAAEVLAWFSKMETQVPMLREQILSGEVAVGAYRYFKVYEPKERQICASAFSEQVLHHALMNVCHTHFEQAQIFDSYASRKNKGTYAALARAQAFSRPDVWFLKLDVRKFFDSVHHEVVREQLWRMFKDEKLLEILGKVLDSYETGLNVPAALAAGCTKGQNFIFQPNIPAAKAAGTARGLPIGNLTSQYFANHYLTGLDHYIKERLRIKAYVRYMDDMVLWHSDKAVLKNAHAAITDFVETKLCCALKPEALNRTNNGLPFLGYHVFPHHTRLLQKSKVRFLRKMQIVDGNYHSGEWGEAKCQRHALPLLAFANHADARNLRENLLLRLKGQSP